MRSRAVLLVLAAALLLPAVVHSAGGSRARETGVPRIVNYDPRGNAPWIGHQSWAAIQDARGVMYFGNTAGLVEYDGVSWRLLPLQPSGTVRSLARDESGRIWIGGQGTFGTLEVDDLGQLRYRDLLEHVPEDQRGFTDVWKTHATPEGVYFQTFSHLFRWADGGLRVWRPDTAFHMSFVVSGRVYIRQEGVGLLTVEGDALELVHHGEEFADERVYVMLGLDDDRILVGTRERGLLVLGDSGVEPFPTEANDSLVSNQLYDGTRLADGSFALATLRGGVVLVDRGGHVLHVLDRTLGVSSSTVTSVFADDSGGLWLTLDRNLSRVEIPAAFTSFGDSTGLEGLVQAVHRHDGRLYAATTLGVYRLEPPRPSPMRPAPVARFAPVTGIASQSWDLETAGGTLLAATTDGVFAVRGLEATQVLGGRALAAHASAFVPGRVYVGLLDGLAVLDRRPDGSWRRRDVPEVRDEVRSIAEAPDGTVVLGGRYRGVWHCVPPSDPTGRWLVHAMSESSGLPLGHGRTLVERIGDTVLVGTSSGLYRFDVERQLFEPATELGPELVEPRCTVSDMHVDPQDRLWLVTSPEPGFGVAEQTDDGWEFSNEAFRPLAARTIWSVFVDEDGIVWVCSSAGLVRYDPAVSRRAPPELRCLIRDVRTLGGDTVLFRGTAPVDSGVPGRSSAPLERTVEYESNSLRFEYAAPHLGGEPLVEYQTRLIGFDRDWSPWSRETWREVTNLPENRYRFVVRARTGSGRLSVPAELALTVRPPWYRRWWALSAFVAAGVLGFVGSIRWQVRRARRIERARAEDRRRAYELQRAQTIQRHMLPTRPPDVEHLDIAAIQHTATEVGGDYYDFFPQASGTLFTVVGDATGHGLGAGLMVAATRTALLTIRDASLTEVAITLNRVLRRVNLGARMNMALTLVEIGQPDDAGRIAIRASGGGMAPMYAARRSGEVEEHIVGGVPLGALPDPEYGLVSLELGPGDALVLMSDGIAERSHPSDGPLGFDGVTRLLSVIAARHAATPTGLTAHEMLHSIVEASRASSGDSTIEDDVTVVVLKVTTPANGRQRPAVDGAG